MKTLEQRMIDAKSCLNHVDSLLPSHTSMIPASTKQHFEEITAYASSVDRWLQLLRARNVVGSWIQTLESHVDMHGNIHVNSQTMSYHEARITGFQSWVNLGTGRHNHRDGRQDRLHT